MATIDPVVDNAIIETAWGNSRRHRAEHPLPQEDRRDDDRPLPVPTAPPRPRRPRTPPRR